MDETHYTFLGVNDTASAAELKKAYRKLAMLHHPDRNPGDEEAARQFRQIQTAYETLSNPKTRAEYDASIGLPPRYERTAQRPQRPYANQWEATATAVDVKQPWHERAYLTGLVEYLRTLRGATDSSFEFFYLLLFFAWILYELLRIL